MNMTYTTIGRPPISEFFVDLFCRSDINSNFVRLRTSKLDQNYIMILFALQGFISSVVYGSEGKVGEHTVAWPENAIECKFLGCFITVFSEYKSVNPVIISCLDGIMNPETTQYYY